MNTTILWFRRDLRLADNTALCKAMQTPGRVVPLFIHAPDEAGAWALGAASRWWLHHSLVALDESLRRLGSRLVIRQGDSLTVLRQAILEAGAGQVCWNRLYEPSTMARDKSIKQSLREDGLLAESFNSALMYEPWEVKRPKGEPYKVFTPYWKSLKNLGLDHAISPAPSILPPVPSSMKSLALESLDLLPKIAWDGGLRENWQPGEEGALSRLDEFVDTAIGGYSTERDRPDHAGTSRLAPHLHFGEIGPRQIAWEIRNRLELTSEQSGSDSYIRELGWREFAHHLLFHFSHTPENPMDSRFEHFAWNEPDAESLQAWQRGRTGIPLVDAGMRELWHTGWMHNRVRMVAASFLVKNLRIHWLEGTRWFWDTLVDADLANNTLGWQWAAGCGADAAPYFRIFNPVLQGERFDPEGDYVRRWITELARLPARFIHQPWLAPVAILESSGVRLGVDYPFPIVDLKTSREQALEAFKQLGGATHQ
ncbi:MAG: cryptochrome/photolyase family protein [Candidatus Methylumidiphilus sp.]